MNPFERTVAKWTVVSTIALFAGQFVGSGHL